MYTVQGSGVYVTFFSQNIRIRRQDRKSPQLNSLSLLSKPKCSRFLDRDDLFVDGIDVSTYRPNASLLI